MKNNKNTQHNDRWTRNKKRQSEKFSSMLGFNNFKASDVWLLKFKQRHNIVLKVLADEAGLSNAFIV